MVEELGQALRAVQMAMDAEKEAQDFYVQAALKTEDPKGRDLLLQLAAFEQNHFRNLEKLLHSLQRENKWTPYAGTQFGERAKAEVEVKSIPEGELNILRYAIDEEKNAEKNYRALAEKIEDVLGKEMFRKLAEEENLHARVLYDQLVSLANKGVWVWGD